MGASARFQPVWVEDVAQVFVRSLFDAASIGQRYDLCGPQVYRLRELVKFAAACRGRQPWIVPLPDTLAWLQASVCNCAFPFGMAPTFLEDIAPQYLVCSIEHFVRAR